MLNFALFYYLNSYLMILCAEAGPLLAFAYICILWIYQYIQYIIVILEFSQFIYIRNLLHSCYLEKPANRQEYLKAPLGFGLQNQICKIHVHRNSKDFKI